MGSRMDKYYDGNVATKRTSRNEKLYDSMQDLNIDFATINYDNSVVITPGAKKQTRAEYQNIKSLESIMPRKRQERQVIKTEKQEEKIYDINEILKLARENKLFDDEKKRLINTEYNILTKLDIDQINTDENLSKENLRDLIDDIYKLEKDKKPKPVIDTKDLLNDLLDEKVEKAIEEGINKKIMEKTYEIAVQEERKALAKTIYDTTVNTSTNVIEKEKTIPIKTEKMIEKDDSFDLDDDKHESFLIVIIIIVVILLAVVGYLFYKYLSTM